MCIKASVNISIWSQFLWGPCPFDIIELACQGHNRPKVHVLPDTFRQKQKWQTEIKSLKGSRTLSQSSLSPKHDRQQQSFYLNMNSNPSVNPHAI